MLVLSGLMVGMLCKFSGFPHGVLGGQVRSELFHAGSERDIGQRKGQSLERHKDMVSLLLHPPIASSPQFRWQELGSGYLQPKRARAPADAAQVAACLNQV